MGKKCYTCGKAIGWQYTQCAECYARNKGYHKYTWAKLGRTCRGCGAEINSKYIYCFSCATKRKLLNKQDY